MVKCKIYFSKFDSKKINAPVEEGGGWNGEIGQRCLKLTHPLEGNCLDGVNDCLEHGNFYFLGEIDAESHNEVWSRIQNIDSSHELNSRSMMCGDVILLYEDGCWNGVVCESIGWSKLNQELVKKFLKL